MNVWDINTVFRPNLSSLTFFFLFVISTKILALYRRYGGFGDACRPQLDQMNVNTVCGVTCLIGAFGPVESNKRLKPVTPENLGSHVRSPSLCGLTCALRRTLQYHDNFEPLVDHICRAKLIKGTGRVDLVDYHCWPDKEYI